MRGPQTLCHKVHRTAHRSETEPPGRGHRRRRRRPWAPRIAPTPSAQAPVDTGRRSGPDCPLGSARLAQPILGSSGPAVPVRPSQGASHRMQAKGRATVCTAYYAGPRGQKRAARLMSWSGARDAAIVPISPRLPRLFPASLFKHAVSEKVGTHKTSQKAQNPSAVYTGIYASTQYVVCHIRNTRIHIRVKTPQKVESPVSRLPVCYTYAYIPYTGTPYIRPRKS
jgi:hypothetical protein